ncbi:TonB-dependent receptor, partial [bacterium]|nr:TonB-dependent receptor [bacterium]
MILSPRFVLLAQDSHIRGRITDRSTGTPLSGANVTLLDTNYGDVADSNGSYQIGPLTEGKYSIEASRIGYETQVVHDVTLKQGEHRIIDFRLASKPIQMHEVTVEAEPVWENDHTKASLVGVRGLSTDEIANTPAAFDDALRAIRIKSGVVGAGDYSGYFSVRGGSLNQNLVVMDGIVIPNPYRFRGALGGGFSNINPAAVGDLRLHLGGYSAEYGNALSSLLEIQSRTGNSRRFSGTASLNATDLNALIEGPFAAGRGSFLLSTRRTYYDVIANRLAGEDSSFPFYFEIMGKVAYRIGDRHRLVASFKRNREGTDLLDDVSEKVNLSQAATTYFGSLTWQAFLGRKWRMRTILSYYNDRTDFQVFEADTSLIEVDRQTLNTKSKNFFFKEDLRYQISAQSWLDLGISATLTPSRVDFVSLEQEFLYARTEFPNEVDFDQTYQYYAAFVEHSSELTSNMHWRIGARYDYSTLIDDGALAPRFSLWYRMDDRTAITGSWGVSHQFPDPMDIYTRDPPLNLSQNLSNVRSEKATHHVLGLERTIADGVEAK